MSKTLSAHVIRYTQQVTQRFRKACAHFVLQILFSIIIRVSHTTRHRMNPRALTSSSLDIQHLSVTHETCCQADRRIACQVRCVDETCRLTDHDACQLTDNENCRLTIQCEVLCVSVVREVVVHYVMGPASGSCRTILGHWLLHLSHKLDARLPHRSGIAIVTSWGRGTGMKALANC